MITVTGCNDSKVTPPVNNGVISLVELDTLWVIGSSQMRRVIVRVSSVEASSGNQLVCQITGEGVSTHFRLFDDGSTVQADDALGFADTISGDRFVGDGFFSRRITSQFARSDRSNASYNFTFRFIEPAVNENALQVTVRVRTNSFPEIPQVNYPDSIFSGDSAHFTADVFDPDGQTDIHAVQIVRLSGQFWSRQIYLMAPGTSGSGSMYHYMSGPEFSAGLPTGRFPFVIAAADYISAQSDTWIQTPEFLVWLENKPPNIINIVGPDTVWVGLNDTIQFRYLISVGDEQTVSDLDSLLLTIRDLNRVLARYAYFDDGSLQNDAGIDSVAGDGIYTAGFEVTGSNTVDVPYQFAWIPVDRSPQRGDTTFSTLVFKRREGISQLRTEPLLKHYKSVKWLENFSEVNR